ncbi:spermatogenesis-associated serine-rich protein 2-like isoform X2 [Haliotis rubra]|uniref:spermatogenesis-associated serine-rich protein 2-like isoform X2 n=1 Tax=Haliotis rubra TaxID=36100 RepID=UPI001EE56E66|nr:spermatogenesis-associated serine-rich protein 2-like isoform X2 [Haliotis rubra]
MARKNNMKSDNATSIHFDTRTKAVMAEVNSEDKVNVKEKVTAVREVVPGKSTNEIVLVLQYYDYNVERAIQAYLEDGAKEALTEWHFTGNKVPNKKKKNKKAKASGGNQSPPSTDDKKTAVSNHTKEPLTNGDVHEDEELLQARARLLDGDTSQLTQQAPGGATAAPPSAPSTTPAPSTVSAPTPTSTDEAKKSTHNNKHYNKHSDKHSDHHPHGSQNTHHQRQRTSRERSVSSVSSQGVKKPFAGLEKSTKDLQRQTISLERLRMGLDSEIEKAYKRVKAVFDEARNCFNDREVQLIREVDALKDQANQVFRMRQVKAADLKVRVERAERLNSTELAELRADIKLFVSDRKVDEDLGRTTRFTYDSDHFLQEIRTFGSVVPVKCSYNTRRPSVSSVASSVGQDEPTSPGLRSQPMHTDLDSASTPRDNTLSAAEMAQLQQRLKDSLQLQKPNKKKGLSVKSPPPRNRPASGTAQKEDGDHGDDSRRNKSGRRRWDNNKDTPPKDASDHVRENHSSMSQSAQSGSTQQTNPNNRSNQSPRRNYSGGQSSPRRYGSGGPRGRGRRGRGDGYPEDGSHRREYERSQRGHGEGRSRGGRGRDGGGRGRSNPSPHPNAQSSQAGKTSGTPAVNGTSVNGEN